MQELLNQIIAERQRQDEKFGEQNHPDGTGEYFTLLAEYTRTACEQAAADGSLSWRHILHEEFAEALAAADEDSLRDELVQVAAVAVAWLQALDRRRQRAGHGV